ncbi:MAG: alpha/beta hydrolase [Tissierellales bacterium]|nr:alpha/beta hydrolase [Tissierellales bacterium]MBN2826803.1 alpha/beta hydrolase [Tissierellales bacterium]
MIIEIDELKINYIQEGSGQDVLLLHGWGCSLDTMRPIMNLISNHYKVTAMDLPGFGASSIPQKAFNSYDYAEVVQKFMELKEMQDVILFGHSHGGRIAIILSAKLPELINKVVLIGSSGILPNRTLKYHLKVFWFKMMKKIVIALSFGKTQQEKVEKFYNKFGSVDYREAQGIMRQTMVKVVNDNLKHLLKDIKAPTLLVWGEKDDATPLYMGQAMEQEIPDSGLVVIKDAGHYAYIDDYNTFKRVIYSFLGIKS